MPQKQGKDIPENNGLIPHHDELKPREPTIADVYRVFEERFDIMNKNLDRMS